MNTELLDTIIRCKSGNRESQKNLYFLTIDRMKNILRRYCKNITDAEDVIQTTYLKIFENLEQFDPSKGDFNSWSNRILINEYFQLLRNRKKMIGLNEDVIEYDQHHQFNWHKFTLEEVQKVIKCMKEPHALLLNLYFIDQFNQEELSKLFNMKESSIRANISRARKAFELIWDKKSK